MVTLIADNYYGYSKKEVKTQISYAANLFGLAEEEHAGGALAFSSYSLGEQFRADSSVGGESHTFADAVKLLGPRIDERAEGYAVDRNFPDVIYVPEDVKIDLPSQRVSWSKDGKEQSIKLLPDRFGHLRFP